MGLIQELFDKFTGFKKSDRKYVYLDKNKEWLFCFKKQMVIEHKNCDYYEHNLECEKNMDYWHRTHSDSSYAGYSYLNDPDSILNECKYCLVEARNVDRFRLSDEALDWLDYCEKRK